jgi:uncharacterized membrane protein
MKRKLTIALLAFYAVLVTYGVLRIVVGGGVDLWITPVSTLIALIFTLLHAAQRRGWGRALMLFIVVFLTGLLLESLGVATGAIYGPYHYTDRLGIKFLGLVPLLIPVAWFMMMYPSMLIAELALPAGWKERWLGRLAIAAVGGLAMTAWDLVMDPLMVQGGHWKWEVEGAYFGIPVQNFWGWWLTTFLAIFIYQSLEKFVRGVKEPSIEVSWAILLYILIGVSNICTGFLFNLEGPALVGIFAMTPWAIVGWIRAQKSSGS